jgi:hypothetical protein
LHKDFRIQRAPFFLNIRLHLIWNATRLWSAVDTLITTGDDHRPVASTPLNESLSQVASQVLNVGDQGQSQAMFELQKQYIYGLRVGEEDMAISTATKQAAQIRVMLALRKHRASLHIWHIA